MLKHSLFALVALSCACGERCSAARFVPLGFLPGGSFSYANAVSADGTVVAGEAGFNDGAGDSGPRAFRWSEATGMQTLGTAPGGAKPINAPAIAGNGNAIVGMLDNGQPYKWTPAQGFALIAPRLAPPVAVSFDGSTIVAGPGYKDVSWDGTTVVGSESNEGYRDKNGVRTWLGDLPGGAYSSAAHAISPDGTMIVGASAGEAINSQGTPVNVSFAMRWTEGQGMVALGPWIGSIATDVSSGKLSIVGYGAPPDDGESEPFRWSPATGMVSVRALLLSEGIDIAAMGWKLIDARSVSANGRVIVGEGMIDGKLQSWLAELPVPGDLDQDGDADGNDFLLLQRGYGATYDSADLSDWRASFAFEASLNVGAVASAVPEPHGAALGAIAFLCVTRLPSKRQCGR